MASLAHFDAQGLEPHEGYSRYTRETFGVSVITAPLEQAAIAPESYDIITLNHVLEHLHYPLTSLSHLNRWLKQGGLLVVEVPNIETTQHSALNRFHRAHIYNFNHDTLKAMLDKAGFAVEPHPAFRGTTLFARKVRAPDPGRCIAMPENYRRLRQLMSGNAATEKLRRRNPVMRFLRKYRRYFIEYIESAFARSPREIVECEFQRVTADASVPSR